MVTRNHYNDNSTTTLFQLFFICLTSLVLIVSSYRALIQFRSADEMPELYPLTPAKIAQFGGSASPVNVGLQISSFSIFDFINNNFEFAGTIWFEFDPSIVSLETISKFSFEKGEIKQLSIPHTRIIGDKLLARFFIKVSLKNNLYYKFFPFTAHTLYLVVENNFLSPSEVVFQSSVANFIISKGIFTSGWSEYDRDVHTGYSEVEELDEQRLSTISHEHHQAIVSYHPRAIFAIDYKFEGIRQTLTILLPLVLIFFISSFSLAMDPRHSASILSISSAGITGLLAYRFVIENLSPKVGYFMLSDWLFFIFLTATFIIFFANTETLTLSKRTKEVITAALHSAIILLIIYLFNFWK